MNEELLNAYTIVRDDASAFIGLLLGFTNDSDAYYAIRRQDPSVMSPVERAARLIYLNKTCYNGLWRVNRSGQFNVPFGKYKNPTICDEANLMAVSSALQGTEIRCTDFEETLCDAAAGDFVYLDPPYDPLSATSSFTGYVEGGFGPEHQTRLARVFARLAHMGCHVLLSNSDTEFIRNLYAEFRIDMVEARRAINCRSDRRGPVSEVLISC